MDGAENGRLAEDTERTRNWKRWGPYLAERQWGTVREDYSEYGDCWNYLPHDHARSRAYRWGEDGLLGITDRQGRLCFALALWNGRDPILKERLFGLTGPEGNHGEDVKELYYYLDSTPTHSYLKALYKYPQAEYPYEALVRVNRERGKADPEFELLDTGVFDDDRYFDVVRRVRQGRRRRHPDSDHRRQPRTRRPPHSTSCRPCGSGTPGAGVGRARDTGPSRRCGSAGAGAHRGGTRVARRLRPGRRAGGRRPGPRAAVHRERDQRGPPLRLAERQRRS